MANLYYKRKRTILFHRQNGKCWWCKREMILPENLPEKIKQDRPPKNMATIDHLRDRYDPKRTEIHTGEKRWVAACTKCNHERNNKRMKEIGIKELQRRSGYLSKRPFNQERPWLPATYIG